ncbi:Cupin domain protein [Meiothermus luteus]|jgi:quercetin dioxygenase-like cupin family protein|uniref:Cupin domain protein n=1 Tax=Meiothermus luteus TaxID=2026184 RepID=A0A399EXL9_9DEIN|nr:cupin domain-containing protein [Meiothermus luteus]RIH88473.1 Cupin domain protein [Meiothermus luteus]RMH57327.1 MAG: cupin domain-containing protein [Deinococcota bacterium]
MQPDQDWEAAEPGVARRLVALGQRMMAIRVRFSEGAEGALHAHPHEQITQVLRGRFRFWLGARELELAPGDTLLIPAGVEHGALALEEGELLDIFSPLREDLLPPSPERV